MGFYSKKKKKDSQTVSSVISIYNDNFDFEQLFSPVINTLVKIFALPATNDYSIVKFNVKTAFLYGEIEAETFMKILQDYNEP